MFPFAHTSKLMTTMATSTVTVANVIVQWPFVMAYRGGLVRLNSSCNRNIEMTPLRKGQMAPSCYSGLQENGADDGGVDERQGVFATGRPARFGGGSYHDPGCG